MKTKLTAAFVIGYDGEDHVIYRNGEVVYENDRIEFVGHDYTGPVDRVVDAGLAIISPGFIDLDALADIDHAILDTWVSPEVGLGLLWSADYFRRRRHDVFTHEEEAFKHRYALSQLALNGITTFMPIAGEQYKGWCETYDEFADVVDIVGELGLRAYLGPSYRSGINVVHEDGRRDVLWDEAKDERGLSDYRLGPINDPIRTLVMMGNVRHVIVDGRAVVEDGRIPGLDTEAMSVQAQAYFEKMRAAYPERDYRRRCEQELFGSLGFHVVEPLPS